MTDNYITLDEYINKGQRTEFDIRPHHLPLLNQFYKEHRDNLPQGEYFTHIWGDQFGVYGETNLERYFKVSTS